MLEEGFPTAANEQGCGCGVLVAEGEVDEIGAGEWG